MEEKFMVSDEIAAKIANRLFQLGISEDLFQSRANISFPLPQEKWEAELAIRSLDMAIVLNELSMQRSYHKHEDDDDEYAFWERFSDEVNKILEDHNIFELVISRMV